MVVEDIQLVSSNHYRSSAAAKAWGIKAGFFYPAIDARDGDEAERAVLDERVQHDEAEADGARDEALRQLVGAELGG